MDNADNYKTFKSFFETLELKCDKGEPAKLVWTVKNDTPDLVYYQVWTYERKSSNYLRIYKLAVNNLIKIY